MEFKGDFVSVLTEYGRLPIKSLHEGLKLYAENQRLRAKCGE